MRTDAAHSESGAGTAERRLDLYRTSTDAKMMIATERLAELAAVTAIASVYDMNAIVYPHSRVPQLIIALLVMLAISGWLLPRTRRQGWS